MSFASLTPIQRKVAPINARRRLAELNHLIDSLVAERQQLLDKLNSVVYPVLSLPPEITACIFVQCITEGFPSLETPPLLLSHICGSWRRIALGTPTLWQSINIAPRRKGQENLLELWLKRSASMPLPLSFGGFSAQSLIDTSLIHHDRWREIALSSPAKVNAGDRDFPILHKVKLSFPTTRPFIIQTPLR
jgi:hypothetical protein